MRLLGPNCLGLINTHHRMNASFAEQMPRPGGISVISQSGALCTAILDWAAGRHLGLAKLISIGNKADLSEIDFLTAFADDPETKVIVGYLESIDSGDAFIEAAEAAAAEKAGRDPKGRRRPRPASRPPRRTPAAWPAPTSPTAPRSSAAGIIRADIVRGDLRLRHRLRHAAAAEGRPRGDHHQRRRAGHHGRRRGRDRPACGSPRSAGSTAAALASKLPSAASVGNPIDVLGDADPDRYVMAVDAAQDDPAVDAIIVILTPQAMTRPAETARAIAACNRRSKPVLVSLHGRAERHARPRGAGRRRPARLPLPGTRRGRAARHVRLRRLAAPPAAHRHPLPGQPPPRRAHHLSAT